MSNNHVQAEPVAEARYYSHVLYFPNRKPFDKPELCWPSFIGEFVAPLVQAAPGMLHWFSNYGLFARFRVFTDDYDGLQPQLETLRDKLGLVDRGEEKNLTLEEDLGGTRFHGPNCRVAKKIRANTILRSLKAVGDLMIESVVQRGDGYWEFEATGDTNQNPVCGHRFSVTHLYHNMTASDAVVYSFEDANGNPRVLSYYYFCNLQSHERLLFRRTQSHRILV